MNRPAAVAGSFYPADPAVLQDMVNGMLDKAGGQTDGINTAPKAMILPHAGYIYSGEIAASGYSLLRASRNKITRVVLLGPTHRVAARGLVTVSVSGFDTPLGTVDIDQQAIKKVLSLPQVSVLDAAHAQEHSLEVHLPFLQTLLDDFSLLPFAVGDASAHEVSEVLEKLWGGDETLILISSDLSHFHDYQTALTRDLATCKAMEELRLEDIDHEAACGATPIRGLLELARRRNYRIHKIDYRNSGDTAGSKDRVVGYAACALETNTNDIPTTNATASRYTWQDGQTLIALARQSIQYALEKDKTLEVDIARFDAHLSETRACFVTLQLNDQLRGCIGSLQAHRSLLQDIAHNARAAAFEDPRFAPLSQAEFQQVEIHLSILSPAEPLVFESEDDLLRQIRPHIDGLILQDANHRATFLPAVWESLPDTQQFWQALKGKAGLPASHWSDTLEVSRYTTQTFP